MAALYEALQSLRPEVFSDIPSSVAELSEYLSHHFTTSCLLVDSVPSPPPPQSQTLRPASNLASSAVFASSARSEPPLPEHEKLQKEWGSPLKLSAKENSFNVGVYKLSSKDGKAAWFARRSVHEGLDFSKWKAAMQKEFPQALEIQGGPGAGNIRSIGADKRVERRVVEGVGTMEVYYLSAQFPGPSAPRDFVTLLLTTENAWDEGQPRHYMVISKPCDHPECPPKSGFVRANYESVEFIREIPRKPKKVKSMADLKSLGIDDDAVNSAAEAKRPSRSRGKTISFVENRRAAAQSEPLDADIEDDDSAEPNPVEWIHVTRSDPGGNVPRFLVERGTPSGIVTDAGKFLDWACKMDHTAEEEISQKQRTCLEAFKANGCLAVADGSSEVSRGSASNAALEPDTKSTGGSSSILSGVTSAAYSSLESYAPKVITDRLPSPADPPTSRPSSPRPSSISSTDTFASAEDYASSSPSIKSNTSSAPLTTQEKELVRLSSRRAHLDAKLAKEKAKQMRDTAALTEREAGRVRAAEERHTREVAKAEKRHADALRRLAEKETRERRKEEEKREKQARREREKAAKKEREDAKAMVGKLEGERDLLREALRQAQAENTRLVALVGRLKGGPEALAELRGKEGNKKGGSEEG